jgi:tRNA(His) 5'-end guanylyltransferase
MTQSQTLGDRMKEYEGVSSSLVLRRTPTIIRLDGRAFHTFTRRFLKDNKGTTPFSETMHNCMVATTNWLVSNIQNCQLGYTQSDEISLFIRDWDNYETQQWFNGKVQKIASISASMATVAFNAKARTELNHAPEYFGDFAMFDSRVFNLPEAEVCNYFIWRQQDASRNSVQMLGHHLFSQNEMHGKNNSEVQDMLMLQHGVNWNDQPVWAKRGTVVLRDPDTLSSSSRTVIDENIPIFTQDRNYINRLLEAPREDEV